MRVCTGGPANCVMSLSNGPAVWGLPRQFISCRGGWAALGSRSLVLSEIGWLPPRIIIGIILPRAKLVNSKRCQSGSGPNPAVGAPAASLGHGLATLPASLACRALLHTQMANRVLCLRVTTGRNSVSLSPGRNQGCLHFCILQQGASG